MVKPAQWVNAQLKQACVAGVLTGLARQRWPANVEVPFVWANLVGEGGFESDLAPNPLGVTRMCVPYLSRSLVSISPFHAAHLDGVVGGLVKR